MEEGKPIPKMVDYPHIFCPPSQCTSSGFQLTIYMEVQITGYSVWANLSGRVPAPPGTVIRIPRTQSMCNSVQAQLVIQFPVERSELQ